MKMQAGMVLGKALLNKRTANIGESEAHLGIKSKEDVGGIDEGTNLYTSTKKEGATTIGGKFKQGVSNLYENVTGDYVEQNPEAIAQVKSQATGDLTQTDQMTTLYGSTAAGEYMDKFQGERTSFGVQAGNQNITQGMYEGTDSTMDYSSLEGSGITPYQYDQQVKQAQSGTGVGVNAGFGQTKGNAFTMDSNALRDTNIEPIWKPMTGQTARETRAIQKDQLFGDKPVYGDSGWEYGKNLQKGNNEPWQESAHGGVDPASDNISLPPLEMSEAMSNRIQADAQATYDKAGVANIDEYRHKQEVFKRSGINIKDGVESDKTPLSSSIDASGEYPNYSRDNVKTAQTKSDEFYSDVGDDVRFNADGAPIPNIPVESEDEFFDEDIIVGKDPEYNLPGFQAKLQRLIPGGKTGTSPIEALDGSYELPHELTRESIAAGEEVEALKKTMEHDANMKSMIEDTEKGAETYRDNPAQQYRDRMEKIDRKEGTGKYSDPGVEVESDSFGSEIGSSDTESRDDLAELGVVPDSDTLPSVEEGIKAEVSATNVEEIHEKHRGSYDKKPDVKEITEKISKNTRASQILKGAGSVKDAAGKIATITSEDKTVAEKLEAGSSLVKKEGGKFVSKQIEKQAAKETSKMVGNILAKKGAENITDIIARQAAKKVSKAAAKAALSIPASVVTGAMDIVEGGEEAGAAAMSGDEVGQRFSQAKQVSGGAAILGGVITAVGLLANLVPGPGTALSAAITPIGIGMMTAGGVGGAVSAAGQIGSSIAQSKRGTTVGRSYKKKFKDTGDRYA
jgi:hypothetical protein